MQALILAGGEGVRLRPLTLMRPKPMMEVRGLPFLGHVLRLLKEGGIDRAVISTCYLGSQIKRYFGDGSAFGVDLTYSHRTEYVETLAALRLAWDALDEEPFFIVNGDTYTELDYRDMWGKWKRSNRLAMVATYELDPAPNCLTDKHNGDLVMRLPALPWGLCVDAGVWVLDRSARKLLPEGDGALSKTLLPALIRERQVKSYPAGRFWDIGTVEKLETFREHMGGKPC